MVRYGQGAYIGLGEVSGYSTDGVAADISTWYRTPDGADGLQMETDLIELEALEAYDQDIDTVSVGQKRITGSITLKMTYGYAQNLLRWITGHNVTVSGAGPYVYAFVPPEAGATSHYFLGTTVRHMVIEVFRGDTASNSVFYQGCIPSETQFKFEPNGLAEVTISIMGRGYTVGAKSTPVFKNDYMRTPTGQSATKFLTLGGTQYRCFSATVTISDPKEHRYEVSDQEPGSHPAPSGFREVTLDVDVEAPDTDTALMNLISDPVANKFSTGVLALADGANQILTMNFDNLVAKPPVEARPSGVGVLKTTLNLKSYSNGGGVPALDISLTNGDAAYA